MPNYPPLVMSSYRRNRRRSSFRRTTNPIQSYKQIAVDGPASRAAATNINHTFVDVVDNYVGPTASNVQVPTGATISSIVIMASFTNLVSISALLHFHVYLARSGTPVVTPGAVGGSPNRNQVVHTRMVFLGQNQNSNWMFRVKIPKNFQRCREGDSWILTYRCDAVFASATQVIYKFYR